MRLRRAWSAPAAPLSHIGLDCLAPRCTGDVEGGITASGTTSSNTNETAASLPRAVYRLFPTQTCFSLINVEYGEVAAVPQEEARTELPTPSAVAPTPSQDTLRAELQAAKHQISLLTAASAQSFKSYAALESENAELRRSNEQLREENEELKGQLAQRDDEISEQLHLICELEKRLEEFHDLTLTKQPSLNGQSGE
jgi:hypothetical protein